MHRRVSSDSQTAKVRLPSGADAGLPVVLFVCVHNAGRSRMAEAFFNQLAGGRYVGKSAGTQPSDHAHPEVIAAMEQEGLELEDRPGLLLSQQLVDEAHLVIGMGCKVEEACPALRVPLEDWDLEDPQGRSPEEVAAIRDQIEMKVRNLIARLDREAADES